MSCPRNEKRASVTAPPGEAAAMDVLVVPKSMPMWDVLDEDNPSIMNEIDGQPCRRANVATAMTSSSGSTGLTRCI